MQENLVRLLLACSNEAAATIERALAAPRPRFFFHRVEPGEGLFRALESEDWQLIISDLQCPGFSAVDLLAWLEETGRDVPVVLVDGADADEAAFRCLEYGVPQVIRLELRYLQNLPGLVEGLLRRAKRDAARRLADQRLLDVFDHTSDLIQCVEPDGAITYTNRAWREAMGYSEDEARSLNLLDILHPDSLLCCQDRFSRLLNGETLNCIDFKFVSRSGEAVHLAGDCGSIFKDGGVVSTRGIFRNITDTVRAEEALKITEARYRALYENAPDIYSTLGLGGEILSINQTGARMLGYEVDELLGESAAKVIHPEDQRAVFEAVARLTNDPAARADIEYRKIRKDGSTFWVHQRATLDPAGGQCLLVVCRDITEKRDLEEKLTYQASHDVLTGLVNRREFERRLLRLLEKDSEPSDRHSLCFLDLDQFKGINDTCGHMAGDELLRQIGALLKGLVRSRDTVARVGGDEFAVLMEYTSLDKALQLAEKIRERIEQFEFHWRAQRFSIGVSIGVVSVQAGQSIVDTLNMADMACYVAKKAGRNRIHAPVVDAAMFGRLGLPD